MFGLLDSLLDYLIGLVHKFDVMHLLDLGLNEKLILLVVHCFIYYKRPLHSIVLSRVTVNLRVKMQEKKGLERAWQKLRSVSY